VREELTCSETFGMDRKEHTFIARHFELSLAVMKAAASDPRLLEVCVAIACLCATSLRGGGKLLLAGNGGSAGDAQHIAGEFISRLDFDRAPLAAIALTADTSVLTATANDHGYEKVFARQVLALGSPGDVFIGISTSGKSPNILRALEAARSRSVHTVGFGGAGASEMAPLCDLLLAVPSRSTPLIQQIHIVAAHAICGCIEAMLFERN